MTANKNNDFSRPCHDHEITDTNALA